MRLWACGEHVGAYGVYVGRIQKVLCADFSEAPRENRTWSSHTGLLSRIPRVFPSRPLCMLFSPPTMVFSPLPPSSWLVLGLFILPEMWPPSGSLSHTSQCPLAAILYLHILDAAKWSIYCVRHRLPWEDIEVFLFFFLNYLVIYFLLCLVFIAMQAFL